LAPEQLSPETQRLFLGNVENDDNQYQGTADQFEAVACEILDICYKKSPDKAVSLLMMPMVYCSKSILTDSNFRGRVMNKMIC
jgi:hypothetical protein